MLMSKEKGKYNDNVYLWSTLPPTIKCMFKAPTYMKAHQYTLISRHQMHCTNSFSMIKIITTLSHMHICMCAPSNTHRQGEEKWSTQRKPIINHFNKCHI